MTRFLLLLTPLVILAGLIVVFALNIDRDPSFVQSVLIDRPVPRFTLPAVAGLDRDGFSSTDVAGEVHVVNVFASWCIPCRDEHPYLTALRQQTGVAIFGINQKDAPENAVAFLAELGNPYDAVGADSDGRVSIEWGVYGVPETFVVDPAGIITYKHIGPIGARSLPDVIAAVEKARTGTRTSGTAPEPEPASTVP